MEQGELDNGGDEYSLALLEAEELSIQGEYTRALEVVRRYIASARQSRSRVSALLHLGHLQLALGEHKESERAFREGIHLLVSAHPSEKEMIIAGLNGIGLSFLRRNNLKEAEKYFLSALSASMVDPKAYPRALGQSSLYLGTLYLEQRLLDKADPYLAEALRIFESNPESLYDLYLSTNNLYILRLLQERSKESKSLLANLLSLTKSLFGEASPARAVTYYNAGAFYYYIQNDPVNTLKYTQLGLEAQTLFLRKELPLLAEGRRSSLLAATTAQGEAAKWLYWWAQEYPGAIDYALTHRINSRGQLADLYRLQLSVARARSKHSHLLGRLRENSRQLGSITATKEQRENLLIQRSELEEDLFRKLPELRQTTIGLDQVSELLPDKGILIEFQKYNSFLGDKNRANEAWGDEGYAAFLLWPNKKTHVVPIAHSSILEPAISKALFASAANLDDAEDLWKVVKALILNPLKPYIADRSRVFISSDGELSRVPIVALLSEGDSGNHRKYNLLSSGRDLLRFQQPSLRGEAPLVIANPNYDLHAPSSSIGSGNAISRNRSSELARVKWERLPGSVAEGEQIASLLGTQAITGDNALVSVIERSRGPRILHIATHGFFVSDQNFTPDDSQQALLASRETVQIFNGEDPLLRSGIVLAGANNPDSNLRDDGILTALEVAALELEGTELVVLSACSTAQGDLRTGEGLYGLQRALTVAGARSTLLSLWKVDDAATAEFMVRFYRRLKAGEGRADALAAVQAEFRSGSVSSAQGEDWSHPYYWAAWQLVGDWRPIKGL